MQRDSQSIARRELLVARRARLNQQPRPSKAALEQERVRPSDPIVCTKLDKGTRPASAAAQQERKQRTLFSPLRREVLEHAGPRKRHDSFSIDPNNDENVLVPGGVTTHLAHCTLPPARFAAMNRFGQRF
eukprot:1635716-Prymnesium_polylepis.2